MASPPDDDDFQIIRIVRKPNALATKSPPTPTEKRRKLIEPTTSPVSVDLDSELAKGISDGNLVHDKLNNEEVQQRTPLVPSVPISRRLSTKLPTSSSTSSSTSTIMVVTLDDSFEESGPAAPSQAPQAIESTEVIHDFVDDIEDDAIYFQEDINTINEQSTEPTSNSNVPPFSKPVLVGDEGEVESDSDLEDDAVNNEDLIEIHDDDTPTVSGPIRSPATGRITDFFPCNSPAKASPTLDAWLGVPPRSKSDLATTQSAMGPPSKLFKRSASEGGQQLATPTKKVPWWQRPIQKRPRAPFYKCVPGTTFLVDSFRHIYEEPPCKSFFLSHFHSDHYGGIDSKFDRGTICALFPCASDHIVYGCPSYLGALAQMVEQLTPDQLVIGSIPWMLMVCVVFGFFKDCTKVTANLLASVLSVKPQYIKALPMNEPVLVEGTTVTLVDANHCPGAACLIFQAPNGKVSLHCGDFRYDAELDDHKYFSQLPMIIDSLFIDTTYCDPKYTFPSQRFVVAKTLEIMEREAINDPRTLIAVGSYTIGKERVYLAAAEKFNCKVFVSTYKYKVLGCLELRPVVWNLVTKTDTSAKIHVVPINHINCKELSKYLKDHPQFTKVVAFKPTGWTFEGAGQARGIGGATEPVVDPSFKKFINKQGNIIIHGVPYSEHSSFSELRACVKNVKHRWLIPTVGNTNQAKSSEMVSMLKAT